MTLLIVEPFYGGSHKQLIEYLTNLIQREETVENVESSSDPSEKFHLATLPAKKWHWRARVSAFYFSENIPKDKTFSVIFCSSVLNLAELIALRPDLAQVKKKIVYFHENQFEYPVQSDEVEKQHRDFQYGYNQILTASVADLCLFNSEYNMRTFLNGIDKHFNLQPDYRPAKGSLKTKLESKCRVLHFPVKFRSIGKTERAEGPLRIVWPHRWEHDKNPASFFEALFKLRVEGLDFRVCVLGEQFSDVPEVFAKSREVLKEEIDKWGYAASKEEYLDVLRSCDVVVSTANHEFFGVAVLEAVSEGCFPLLPKRISYPEIFNGVDQAFYSTDQQMYKKLREYCKKPWLAKAFWNKTDFHLDRFSAGSFSTKARFNSLFEGH